MRDRRRTRKEKQRNGTKRVLGNSETKRPKRLSDINGWLIQGRKAWGREAS